METNKQYENKNEDKCWTLLRSNRNISGLIRDRIRQCPQEIIGYEAISTRRITAAVTRNRKQTSVPGDVRQDER